MGKKGIFNLFSHFAIVLSLPVPKEPKEENPESDEGSEGDWEVGSVDSTWTDWSLSPSGQKARAAEGDEFPEAAPDAVVETIARLSEELSEKRRVDRP